MNDNHASKKIKGEIKALLLVLLFAIGTITLYSFTMWSVWLWFAVPSGYAEVEFRAFMAIFLIFKLCQGMNRDLLKEEERVRAIRDIMALPIVIFLIAALLNLILITQDWVNSLIL